ncbi:hypothetical protein M758_3G100300 [Ceratodon purpureus]|nr:hypothetical protein M758_3G100300 [Ceratodon purpureus]
MIITHLNCSQFSPQTHSPANIRTPNTRATPLVPGIFHYRQAILSDSAIGRSFASKNFLFVNSTSFGESKMLTACDWRGRGFESGDSSLGEVVVPGGREW